MSRLLPFKSEPTQKPDGATVLSLEDEATDEALSALASETAREILSLVYEEPMTPPEIRDEVETSLQNVHYHLENLEEAGLVQPAGTGYSEKGTEMTVYSPASEAVVLFAGQEADQSRLKTALTRLLGAVGLLALASYAVRRLARTTGVGTMAVQRGGDGGVGGGDAGAGDGGAADPSIEREADAASPQTEATTTAEPVTTTPEEDDVGIMGGGDGGGAATTTPAETATPAPTGTPAPSPTPGPTGTPAPTPTPEPAGTPTATPTQLATETPAATQTPEPTPTSTPAATQTPEPTATPTPVDTTVSEGAVRAVGDGGLLADPAVTFFLGGVFMLAVVGVWWYYTG